MKETQSEVKSVREKTDKDEEECRFLQLENEALKKYISNYQKLIKAKKQGKNEDVDKNRVKRHQKDV